MPISREYRTCPDHAPPLFAIRFNVLSFLSTKKEEFGKLFERSIKIIFTRDGNKAAFVFSQGRFSRDREREREGGFNRS